MDAPSSIQEPKKCRVSLIWSLAGFGISTLALFRVGYVLREFYLDTASVAAGTEVRPMGVTFHLAIACLASIVFGGICALVGGIIALIQRRWRLFILAFMTGAATWIPSFVTSRGFAYVVEVRKLILEP
jgi:hypothetical protein